MVPWAPVYGTGCVLICFLIYRIGKQPISFFFISSAVYGIIEYFTSWLLETLYHARWWDYSNQILNLNGRISALSVFFFGLAGLAVAFLLKPAFDRRLRLLSPSWKRTVCRLLIFLFLLDCVYSLMAPNMGIGVHLLER